MVRKQAQGDTTFTITPGFPLRSAIPAESLRSGSGADFADCGVGGVEDGNCGVVAVFCMLSILFVARVLLNYHPKTILG